ncbi:hypothetical protein [Microbacterium paraoxydans]|uniref:hypothetical protein n=1 Tax=Microbacterium paraoxydans TaxID=199592 RepID=UPI0021A67B38|nr:hypothetical protein [Microbacterium paraoxydans]MCT2224091.1 hypothetical protein [Microbacterium paraoxydans]
MEKRPRLERGLIRVPVTDADELDASRVLTERLLQIDPLLERYATIAQLRAKPASELGEDDRRTSWLHLSHFVASCMSMATDSLAATTQLLLPDGEQLEHRVTAHFPLLRSALESASTALWLLRPDDQRERIIRLLQLRTTDIDYDLTLVKAAAKLADLSTSEGRSASQAAIRGSVARRKRHMHQMTKIAEAEGISVDDYTGGAPGHGVIVEQATDYPDLNGGYASTVWRLISGLTHPSPLRMMSTSKHGGTVDNEDGTLYVVASMNLAHTTNALLAAMMTYRQATETLAARVARIHSKR